MDISDKVQREEAVNSELKHHFKPEFLNRLDDIVIFNPLGIEAITSIVDIIINSLENKLKERDMKLVLSKSAKELIAKTGYDPVYGARPLKRAVYALIEDEIAQLILEDKFQNGDTLSIDTKNDALEFSVA